MALQSFTVTLGAFLDSSNSGANYVTSKPVYVKNNAGVLANIFSDFDGLLPIPQNGINNISNNLGQFTFFVDAGDYIIECDGQTTPVTIVGADYFNNKINDVANSIVGLLSGLLIEAYDVPAFTGDTFTLPKQANSVYVTINGRGLGASDVELSEDGLTVTLLNHSVTDADTVVARAAFVDLTISGGGGEGGGVNTIPALVALGDSFDDGYQVSVASYHNVFSGGAGVYAWSESQLKATHNGGTIIDPTAPFPADWNDDAEREAWYNANNAGTGCWVRANDSSIRDACFGVKADNVTDDYLALDNAVKSSVKNLDLVVGTRYITQQINAVPNGKVIKGLGGMGNAAVRGEFEGGVFENATGQWWKNKFINIGVQNASTSVNAAAIKGTMYQGRVEDCVITCFGGKGLHLLGNAYCVENVIEHNYFNGCKYGIYAESGSHANTDAWIVDNYFWRGSGSRETAIVNSIYCETPSGSTFRGNHFYGGSDDAMLRLFGGDNVSILDNYFEGSDNPRLKIQGGNPSTFTITGNKFWMGDGNKTDSLGDKSSIISFRFNLYNPCSISFSGNIFSGGVNEVPIFSMRNGDDGVSGIKISFDKSNVLRGSYSLADLAASGDADVPVLGRIDSNHSEFVYESTAQNESPTSFACSEFHQYDTGNAETFPVLASNTASVSWKPKIVHNLATTTEISLSSGATIENNRRIKPGEIAIIRTVDSSTYRLEFLKEKSLTVTSYPLTTLDFGAGSSIPAGGQVESNIEPLGYPLTNPETILTCYPKSLAPGLVATVYYNQSAFNNWVLRLTNTTGSSITNTTSTAIVNIFEGEA